MTSKLKEIKIKKAKDIIKDKDIINKIQEDNESVFMVDEVIPDVKDSLLGLEISLRKGERIGFFKK